VERVPIREEQLCVLDASKVHGGDHEAYQGAPVQDPTPEEGCSIEIRDTSQSATLGSRKC
jgi:hypothetical protein